VAAGFETTISSISAPFRRVTLEGDPGGESDPDGGDDKSGDELYGTAPASRVMTGLTPRVRPDFGRLDIQSGDWQLTNL
jgi:hypothetical protein